MHLETLRLYCDVVRLRSFSRGAEENFVSQSAASQAVQQLEGQLGVALIDRTKRPFVVTREGEAFYAAARGILESWEKAKTEVAAVKARVDGTVRVAAIYSVGLHDMSRPMQQFMSLYPQARVQLAGGGRALVAVGVGVDTGGPERGGLGEPGLALVLEAAAGGVGGAGGPGRGVVAHEGQRRSHSPGFGNR